MARLTVNRPEKSQVSTFVPNNEIVLITGKIEILGVPLFCGSVVYDSEEGFEIKSCKVIAPDMVLYNELNKNDASVGSIFEINRKRNKSFKNFKNSFEINRVTVEDEEATYKISDAIENFDISEYSDSNMVF